MHYQDQGNGGYSADSNYDKSMSCRLRIYVSVEDENPNPNSAKFAWNLGAIFGNNFTFCSQVSAACSPSFYHMRDMRRIRRHLDLDSAQLLANALVSSRFWRNWPFSGIADTDLSKFLQDRLAHAVTMSQLLHSFHWLPVTFRILFKINLLTYKTLHEKTSCLSPFHACPITPIHSLRSSKGISPCVHWNQTKASLCRSLGSVPM